MWEGGSENNIFQSNDHSTSRLILSVNGLENDNSPPLVPYVNYVITAGRHQFEEERATASSSSSQQRE